MKAYIAKKENLVYTVVKDGISLRNFYVDAEEENISKIGKIVIGRVMKSVKGIGAYFVRYGDEKDGYLAFDQTKEVLNEGQEVLVQVIKDAYGTKGAKLTTYISLTGENLVLLTDTTKIIYSSKSNKESLKNKKHQLKKWLLSKAVENENEPEIGFILRTNADNVTEEILLNEAEKLYASYKKIIALKQFRSYGEVLMEPLTGYMKRIQDLKKNELEEIQVDDQIILEKLKASGVLSTIPTTYSEHSLYLKEDVPKILEKLTKRKVWLPSGASIVIDRTEAMYVIDINSNKNISNKKFEQQIVKINTEAAKEIMQQIRLRNLSGIILIDCIDMKEAEEREALLMTYKKLAKKDSIRTVVHGMTSLELVELTRKRLEPSLEDKLAKYC